MSLKCRKLHHFRAESGRAQRSGLIEAGSEGHEEMPICKMSKNNGFDRKAGGAAEGDGAFWSMTIILRFSDN